MKETNFKPSPLGPIPHDWEVKELHELLSLFGRIGFRGYNATDLVAEGQGAITLSPSNMRDGAMDFTKCTYISWHKYEESPEIKIYEDDILMVKTGSTYGKTALVSHLPSSATINPQLVVFKKLKCNAKFLASFLSRNSFQSQVETIASGGAIPTMSQAKIIELKVALPSRLEQDRIASALSDVDKLIATTEALLQKKRDIKQGTMQQLLSGKRRLPGFTQPWEMVLLSNVTSITMGQSPASSSYNDNRYGLPLIQGKADWKNRKQIVRTFTSAPTKICEANSVIMSVRAPVGAIAKSTSRSCLGRGVCSMNEANDFLYHYLIFRESAWFDISGGSVFESISGQELSNRIINIPSDLGEQQAIAKVLTDMDNEIEALEDSLTKYKAIREAMMQQLLTGKIRLI